MAEKKYFISIGDATTSSQKIALSGIVKRIRIERGSYIEQTLGQTRLLVINIHPTLDTYALDIKSKFFWSVSMITIAGDVSRYFDVEKTKSFETNFYVDKEDYLIFRNNCGNTQLVGVTLDVVPVTDKTRLYLGGEYHNQ